LSTRSRFRKGNVEIFIVIIIVMGENYRVISELVKRKHIFNFRHEGACNLSNVSVRVQINVMYII